MFLLSTVFAETKTDLDKYRLFVAKVDPEFHCFALSNNMVFNIPKKNWKTESLPEVGTEVYLKPTIRMLEGRSSYKEEGDFVVKFSQDPMKKPVTAWMTKDSEQYCLSFVSSESVCTQSAIWITRGVYQNVLVLSDGSKWLMPKDDEVEFTPGDRIMVSKIQEDDYMIIDIDRSMFFCGEETASGKTFMWYKLERTKPYVPVEFAKE
jgi:hypothetical protein